MKNASIVQEKALASKNRREAEAEVPVPSTVWGEASRLDAMKQRLLHLEMEKIAAMDPDRLVLMNLLADHGHSLDENTVSALLAWKRS